MAWRKRGSRATRGKGWGVFSRGMQVDAGDARRPKERAVVRESSDTPCCNKLGAGDGRVKSTTMGHAGAPFRKNLPNVSPLTNWLPGDRPTEYALQVVCICAPFHVLCPRRLRQPLGEIHLPVYLGDTCTVPLARVRPVGNLRARPRFLPQIVLSLTRSNFASDRPCDAFGSHASAQRPLRCCALGPHAVTWPVGAGVCSV